MLKKINLKNIILIAIIILLIPFIVPLFSTILEILLNLGRYIGTISRQISEGMC